MHTGGVHTVHLGSGSRSGHHSTLRCLEDGARVVQDFFSFLLVQVLEQKTEPLNLHINSLYYAVKTSDSE